MKTLCLMKFSALGDLTQIEPFLPSLSQHYAITLFTSPIGYEYYKESSHISDFIILPSKKLLDILKIIPKYIHKFDYLVDLQGNNRSKFLSFFSMTTCYSNYQKNFKIATLTPDVKPYILENSIYHLDVYSILASLKISFYFDAYTPKEKKYIVLNCGSSQKWVSKRLSLSKWKEISTLLYEKFQLPFVFTGDASEIEYIKEIAQYIGKESKILAGKTNLQELKKTLKNAFLTVSTDSASMHISAVVGTPTIGIFGPTNWLRAAPFGPWSTTVYDTVFYPNSEPPLKNSQKVDYYFDYIDISNALTKLMPYLN
ncbi:MAG: glycosyltransferase family 9 protein [Sulfurospirillaceae bacterium]|nr:glycosyltransferase family 9 protein [Sulfurospirillaceae bacterium]